MSKEIKTIRLSEMRPDECHLAIDSTDGSATGIASVVVRMAGATEDKPELVEFANALVDRYNDYILPPPDAELVKASLRDEIAKLKKELEEVGDRNHAFSSLLLSLTPILVIKHYQNHSALKKPSACWLIGLMGMRHDF